MTLQLDALFRQGSKARQVADILLSGEVASRGELADRVSVSPTTIPRVVNTLEGAGVRIQKTVRDDNSTEYRVVGGVGGEVVGIDKDAPGVLAVYTAAGRALNVDVLDIKIDGGDVWVEFTAAPIGKQIGVVRAPSGGSVDIRVLVDAPQMVALAITDRPGFDVWVGKPHRHLALEVQNVGLPVFEQV